MDPFSILLIVLMVLAFWLLLIRPNQQRQKAARELQESLTIGDEVMLASGMFGTLEELTDDHAYIQLAPGTTVKVVRQAVAAVVRETTDAEVDDHGDADEER